MSDCLNAPSDTGPHCRITSVSTLYQDAPIDGSIFAVGYYNITLVIDTSVLSV